VTSIRATTAAERFMPTMGTAWRMPERAIYGSEYTGVVTDAGMEIHFDAREGRFQPWWHQVAVRVMHWSGGAQAFLDGKRIADPVTRSGILRVTIDDPSAESRLSLKTKSGR